jgi:hypothetical protein
MSELLPSNCWPFPDTRCYGQLIAVVEKFIGRIPEYMNTKLWNVPRYIIPQVRHVVTSREQKVDIRYLTGAVVCSLRIDYEKKNNILRTRFISCRYKIENISYHVGLLICLCNETFHTKCLGRFVIFCPTKMSHTYSQWLITNYRPVSEKCIVANLFSILFHLWYTLNTKLCGSYSHSGHVNDETVLKALTGYTIPPIQSNSYFRTVLEEESHYSIRYSVCSTLHKCLFLSSCLRKPDGLFRHNKEYIFLHVGFDACRSKCWNFLLHFSICVRLAKTLNYFV